MANKADEAVRCFAETFNCAQAVAHAYGPDLGLDPECALRVASAFGGGIALTGTTCGAVTGALMIIGLAYGKTKAEDTQASEETYRIAATFVERFKERNFTILCRELVGCDAGTPEGKRFMKEHNLRDRLCSRFVRDAAEILEDLLVTPPKTE